MTNLLVALANIVGNPITDLISFYGGSNRANNMGDALETYVKDIFYIIGVAPKGTNKLKVLWFVHGDCYAANRAIYKRIADKISNGISEIPDVGLSETNELAGVKKVDPLGITNLRVRGMWHIQNPIKVFRDVASVNGEHEFTVNTILLEEKYLSFPEEDRKNLENLQNRNFKIQDIKIKSPNNPAQFLNSKLIFYSK